MREASEPEVIVLSPDLGANAIGRAAVFADLLNRVRPVTIVGWSRVGVHPLVEGRGLRVEPVSSGILPSQELRARLARATVIASKPLWRSFGWALRSSQRVILDIDDPELALLTTDLRTFARASVTLGSPPITGVLLSLRHRAGALTVSNGTLARRFGGVVIPHARDEAYFTDELRDRAVARAALGLPAHHKLVAFVGTARRHKGITELLSAASSLSSVQFTVVGAGDDHPAERGNVRYVGRLPYPDAMRWVAAADVIAVPQRRTAVGLAQAPAKLVDAMAMGRAVVASDLPPIREMLGSAAYLYDPTEADGLRRSLSVVLEDEALRSRLATDARRRFEAELSLTAIRPRLLQVLSAVEATA